MLNPNAPEFVPIAQNQNCSSDTLGNIYSRLNPNAPIFVQLTIEQVEHKDSMPQLYLRKPHNAPGTINPKQLDNTPKCWSPETPQRFCGLSDTSLGKTATCTMPPGIIVPATPCVNDISTPEFSDISGLDGMSYSTSSESSNTTLRDSYGENSSNNEITNTNITILNEIRKKYVNNVVIGHLNINSLPNKFDALKVIIEGKLDILVLVETKLDDSFPEKQFFIDGYTKPYRLDRNRNGGGLLIYVRKDIPSKQLNKHNFTKNVEALFVEINLRKCKLLLTGTYHSKHPVYGTSDIDFFEQMGLSMDVYSNYDKFLLVGDFNIEVGESPIDDFLYEYGAKSLVKDYTCFKSICNPSCIDLFLTNSSNSFQCTKAISTGLSDFHKMVVTVFKTTFPKVKPKVLLYRNYSKFVESDFYNEIEMKLHSTLGEDYELFHSIFLSVLNHHAPYKKKFIRANHKPYVTKKLRKAIMKRSRLENKFYKNRTEESSKAFKKQKNYCNRLYKRERRNFYTQLDLKEVTDNKMFWKTVSPLFGNKGGCKENIVLVDGDKVISEDAELAQTFNDYFENCVNALNISENRFLLVDTGLTRGDSMEECIKKFQIHPSIRKINENVKIDARFSFSEVNVSHIRLEIKNLDSKKAGIFMGIPTKHLKQTINIICEPLMNIWNKEIVQNKLFPTKLKLADINPIFKQFEHILVKNYRPVSILPVISKIFERLMQKQINAYVDKYLSPHLCGYRKGYSSQYALLAMIERWKCSLDNGGFAGGIMMDLSKAFDTINHQLLIAKLYAYGFSKDSLHLILDYLSNRWYRTKINASFSSWTEVLCGVPQGSILGPLLFNIYLNDLFYEFVNTRVCNLADDNTTYACNINLSTLLDNLEHDTLSAIMWFELNYMKLNEDKCHFLLLGEMPELMWAQVGDERLWESCQQKLLGLMIDKQLKFDKHLSILCKTVSSKVSALARMVKIIPFHKKKLLMRAFIESQFSYCPLIWMFCSRKMNRKINHIHEKALRLVYEDYSTSFEELLVRDKSVSIHHRNIQKVAIEMFKVKHNLCPQFISSLFYPSNTRTRSNSTFLRPNVNTVFKGEQSVRSFGPIVWDNMLPQNLKELTNIDKFKYEIKRWVPRNCVCRLCKDYVPNLGFATLYE